MIVNLVDDPPLVLVDPDRIEQLVANLLDNAMKYSPPDGEVQVSLVRDAGGLLVRVRDQGIGLPADSVERIFEPFGRADNVVEAQIPGLGLGLYVCRQIATQHGGRLWGESPGEKQATTVLLWLPPHTQNAEVPAGA